MRDLNRNKQTIYYALYQGKQKTYDADGYYTGEPLSQYSAPVEMKANVSPAKGTSDVEQFGVSEDYTKTIVTTDLTCPIDEMSRLWVDTPATDESGAVLPHNYAVIRVAKSINSITYAVKEVSTS